MKRGAYLLPSSLTLVNLGLGFFAIIQSINGNYGLAAWAIVFGHVCDIIDGMVARVTKTTSTFGLEFDSFADWITFGIAPAILMYQLVLNQYGKVGFSIALFFAITGSLRLAKYNVMAHEDKEGEHFAGLPIPAAGGVLAAIVLIYDMSLRPDVVKTVPFLMELAPYLIKVVPGIMFVLSLLMVSRIRYFSSKHSHMFRPRTLRWIVFWVLWGLVMYSYPQNFTFFLYFAYITWGLIKVMIRAYRLRRKQNEAV